MKKRKKTTALDVDGELLHRIDVTEDVEAEPASSGGSDTARRASWSEIDGESMLIDETRHMDRDRRHMEQQGHRRYFARVNAREHNLEDRSSSPEGELQNDIPQNPWLDSQRFDGADNNVNAEPRLNTEARREFDNQRREQEMEKQLRLGNMPQYSNAPKPQGP